MSISFGHIRCWVEKATHQLEEKGSLVGLEGRPAVDRRNGTVRVILRGQRWRCGQLLDELCKWSAMRHSGASTVTKAAPSYEQDSGQPLPSSAEHGCLDKIEDGKRRRNSIDYLFKSLIINKAGAVLGNFKLALLNLLAEFPVQAETR